MRKQVIFLILFFVVFCFNNMMKISRYILINLQPLRKQLLENYHKIPRVIKKQKVIISFTTIPNRIDISKYMLSSILDQTVRVDEVRLYIPHKTFKGQEYTIPTWMKNLQKTWPEFSIKVCDKDWGPATKIIPAVLDEKDSNNFLIYMDDDMVYHPETIERLITASNRHPRQAICHVFSRNCMEGFAGCLVRPAFFDIEKLTRQDEYPKECFFEDDVYISGMLTENRTKIFCTKTKKSIPYFYEFFVGFLLRKSQDSLSSNVNKDRKNFRKASECFKWNQTF